MERTLTVYCLYVRDVAFCQRSQLYMRHLFIIIIIIIIFIRTAGQTSRSVRLAGSGKMAMIKYHMFAWTTPGIIVVTSYVLDTSGVVYIGYGKFLY